MTRGMRTWVLAGALALGGAAQAQTQVQVDQQQVHSQAGQQAAPGTGVIVHQRSGVEIPSDPKAFLERLHQDNQEEIRLGQLARERSQNKDVRDFADKLVRDHQQMDDRLMAQALKMNLNLGQPQPLDDTERKIMAADEADRAKLQVLRGNAFDSAYLSEMVSEHDMTLGKLIVGQQHFQQGGLVPLLKDAQDKVSGHRDRAYKLLGDEKPSTS